jgi:hypothetical protein
MYFTHVTITGIDNPYKGKATAATRLIPAMRM